jgi:protein-S-isoprenylcysteine O-methyltransferase Ste14
MGAWQHLRAILLLPFVVAVVIPCTLLWRTGPDTLGLWQSYPATRMALPILGGALLCLGLVLLVGTIRLFVTVGKGTLVTGIAGVFFVLLGEAILAASLPLFIWFVVFVLGNAVYIPVAEEPGLVNRFGDNYLAYQRDVPRWIPRLRPWEAPGPEGEARRP